MKNNGASFLVGFLFALGLGISGMTQPQKVIGFLDIFGNWDPSLLFVMLGAVTVHFVFYRWIRKRKHPLLAQEWKIPSQTSITPSLIVGALLFGVGWGLAGYCPGPAVVSLAGLNSNVILFVVSLLIGIILFQILDKKIKFNK